MAKDERGMSEPRHGTLRSRLPRRLRRRHCRWRYEAPALTSRHFAGPLFEPGDIIYISSQFAQSSYSLSAELLSHDNKTHAFIALTRLFTPYAKQISHKVLYGRNFASASNAMPTIYRS